MPANGTRRRGLQRFGLSLGLLVPALVILGPPSQATDLKVAEVVASGLMSPWGLAFLPDGSALVSERDTGRVLRIDPAKPAGQNVITLGKVPGSIADGEGGLLGIAIPPTSTGTPPFIYAYTTTQRDNRVLRINLNKDATRLGATRPLLTGIPKNSYHNGGRLLVANDGTLFVATGDAGDMPSAQNSRSLAGKILHINPDGSPATGNPNPKSPIYSLGHRNVQGLAFDAAGNLWASEFGFKDADELNLIVAGGNYGWPQVEGIGKDSRFRDPEVTWSPTSLASPSGIAIDNGYAYVASLRGEVLWQVPLNSGTPPSAGRPKAVQLGKLGRLRTVSVAPDGSLWLMTSNTDGRGDPRRTDDLLLRLTRR
ncbi:MAG: PQQ-dependent sugar dehydrogenase [Actinomycetales bacterium]